MEGKGWLICLTQLWPKVSCHIPDPAETLPSPKHGALGKGEGGGEEWAGEVLGQVAWGAEPARPREARPATGSHRPISCPAASSMSQSPRASVFLPGRWVNQ